MSRWMPTLAQLEEARARLPNPYAAPEHRGPTFHVQVMGSIRDYNIYSQGLVAENVHSIRFELEHRRDSEGFKWARWVYSGQVAV